MTIIMNRGAVWLTRLQATEDLSLSVSLRNTHRPQTSARQLISQNSYSWPKW